MRQAATLLRPTALVAAALAAVLARAPVAEPSDPPKLAVPKAEGLVLDGALTEAAWASAPEIPVAPVASARGTASTKPPRVRVLASKGRLWLGVEAAEDPGVGMGVDAMVATEGTATAADATALAYKPQDPRVPRYVARGKKGAGRGVYRVAGAVDLAKDDLWSLELAVPLADLGVEPATGVRLAVSVATRGLKDRPFAAPPGSVFQDPASFAALSPPEGGWPAGDETDVPPAAAVSQEDAADDKRMESWRTFEKALRTRHASAASARAALIPPIDAAIVARPDLAMLHLLRAEILAQVGATATEVGQEYDAALAIAPHLPEGEHGRDQALVDRWTTLPPGSPSDYEAALARVAEEGKKLPPASWATRIAEGILRYRKGEFEKAAPLLREAVASGGTTDPNVAEAARAATSLVERWKQEEGFRAADEKGDLPRVKVTTSRGAFTLELFEDDAPNTVANFVWLARKGFYTKTKFHRVIPLFMAQGGDPVSRRDDPRAGEGGPGYAIPTEPPKASRVRVPFRGTVAFANGGPDTNGSQFFVTTGTSAHLEGKHAVFGRVVEGMDVVDRIAVGDVIESVEVVRARDHEYRPTTVAGTPAPEPVEKLPDGR
jgi:peptidyl-prolyl cis-trans isomerase B (cyclophilin B)